MTPLELLDALEAFVKQETKDILLPVRVDRKSGENKERAAEVYKMRLPNTIWRAVWPSESVWKIQFARCSMA